MKLYYILFTLILSNFYWAFAQNTGESTNRNAQKLYQQAGQALSVRDLDKASGLLREAVKADPSFLNAWQQIGDIDRRLKNYPSSITAYQNILSINPEFLPRTYYGLADSELHTGSYAAALQHFKKYLTYPGINPEEKKRILKSITDCEFSIEAIKRPVKFEPKNLGDSVNTRYQEYLPVLTADEGLLIFTRMSNNNEDFYRSVQKDSKWARAQYLSNMINTPNFNEGAQCISPDGMYLFFTACNRPGGAGSCDIYLSRREGNSWSRPYNLGRPLNSGAWESQPSLSADGRTLYFSSTRPGGFGGYDIWKSNLLEGGEWSEPENMGPAINTEYDEQSPFIHPDGQTFYFSSNGWPGFGDKDIFFSRADASGKWQKPINLGYPINTFDEESSLTISNDGSKAFFASNKEGGFGGLDIYSFEMPVELRPQPVTFVKGIVVDKNTGKTLDAKIQLVNLQTDKLAFDDVTDAGTGEFLATMPFGQRFALNVSRPGYLFYSENYTLNKPSSAKPYIIKVPLQQIEVGGLVVLNNIFFDTNKSELLPESKIELNELVRFLNENPMVAIEIGGHTDNVGDLKSNLELSQHRARTVHNYLVANKINPARLTFKGFGESKPLADNSTEEGRKNNRRTEFTITRR